MNSAIDGLVAKAEPSKGFFIDMLTKDIPLSVCILDLLDNSINSLISGSGLDVSEHLIAGTSAPRVRGVIEIEITPSRLYIKDNCGGVSISEAENEVFLMGGGSSEGDEPGLGVYGIGMKRAFFKIGRRISFESHTNAERFKIDIDVNAWKKNPDDWSFPFTHAEKKASPHGGTEIEITQLHEVVSQQFGSRAFKSILVSKIARAYALFVKAGLKIKVDGQEVKGEIPQLASSKDLQPVRQLLKKDGVEILIIAGLSPADDKTPRGWYVFCNGRMILDADKSERTGWGVESRPGFHSKFNHFLGYVYFRSTKVRKLPWSTTKDDVDRESAVYQYALSEMWLQSRPILDFLSELYSDVIEESQPEYDVFRGGKAITPQKIASRSNTVWKVKLRSESSDDLVSIQYKRPKKKIQKIKEVLGSSISASRIGEYTFDWFYDRNCK